mgnify:CR=1 FL=1
MQNVMQLPQNQITNPQIAPMQFNPGIPLDAQGIPTMGNMMAPNLQEQIDKSQDSKSIQYIKL